MNGFIVFLSVTDKSSVSMHKKQELSEEVEREKERENIRQKNEAHILYKYSTKTAKQKE
ncbi:hypothetical protein M139_4363 [Bacteroides fragilis str. S23L24]|nr:hypothetical protein M139_4363 [Bacteroides fragilis str. S23L24]EYE41678.1 hypothetical protein M138_4307 [Bacteroides fragilis str. S23L17]MCS2889217.1 hypothetical protein [Bacteroides fragilis]